MDASNQAVGKTSVEKGFLEETGLGVGAIKDGNVGKGVTGAGEFGDFIDEIGSFIEAGTGGVEADALAAGVFGPEIENGMGGVFGDNLIGGLKDGLGGAVVLFEVDGGNFGKILDEIIDVVIVGTTPGVDGLAGIGDGG